MKRLILLVCILLGYTHTALADYTSIIDMKDNTPERMEITVETRSGIVQVDSCILLPQSNSLPVFTVQYKRQVNKSAIPSDADYSTDSYNYSRISKNYAQLYPFIQEESFLDGYEVYYKPWSETNAENNSCTPEEIHEEFRALMYNVFGNEETNDYIIEQIEATSRPWLWNANDKTIIKPLMDEGVYHLYLIPSIRGIPIVDTLQSAFALDAPKAPVIPQPFYSATYKNRNIFSVASYDAVEEKALLAENIPLLPWPEIQVIIESLLRTEQIKSISEIRLCELVLYNTPDLQKDVFMAMPCWRITGTLTDKIFGGTDDAITECFINAQTGEVFDTYSKQSDRACANELITWDQLTK